MKVTLCSGVYRKPTKQGSCPTCGKRRIVTTRGTVAGHSF